MPSIVRIPRTSDRSGKWNLEGLDIHPYITVNVGLLFIPIFLFVFSIPFIIRRDDSLSLKIFLIASPILIILVTYINYCIAGVCPRYLIDLSPFASILGALCALKILEKDDGKHNYVPIIIVIILLGNIYLTSQYHFIGFDVLRIGDFYGLLAILKTIVS